MTEMLRRLSARDRRALTVAASVAALLLVVRLLIFPALDAAEAARAEIPIQEETLAKYQRALSGAGKEAEYEKAVAARLQQAETGLLQATGESLAYAEVDRLVKQVATAQGIEIRSSEMQRVARSVQGYREVAVGVQFNCSVEQLVNLLNALQASPKVISVSRLSVQPAGGAQKQLQISLTASGWIIEPPTGKK